jgi:phage terminase small subunit
MLGRGGRILQACAAGNRCGALFTRVQNQNFEFSIMPGRPSTPTNILKLRGTARKCRLERRRGELALPPAVLLPPAFLPPEAIAEWERVTSLSKYAKALTEADRPTLALYCGLHAEWEKSFLPGKKGKPMQTSRMALYMNVAGKLGMNPSDRVRVHVPAEEKPENKFAQITSGSQPHR